MRRTSLLTTIILAAAVGGLFTVQELAAGEEPSEVDRGIAVVYPTEGNVTNGIVTFTQAPGGVKVSATIEGLKPGKHGFHIHELGDCSAPDATSAGGHFNPDGNPHAGPDQEKRHIGDLGNLEADKFGQTRFEQLNAHLMLNGPKSIIGRAVIVHEGEDDLISQPTGNAGGRIACGVIGIAR